MIPHDLQYGFPQAFYLLIASPIFIFVWWKLVRYRNTVVQTYSNQPALFKLVNPRVPSFSRLNITAFSLCWILCCIALAGPEGNIHYILESDSKVDETNRKLQNIIFLVDTSASMGVIDVNYQSRLDSSKDIAVATMSQFKGSRFSLYAFTSHLISLAPLTMDQLFVKLSIKSLQINEGGTEGTDLFATLSSLKQKLSNFPSQSYTIILLSDGGDNNIEKLQGSTREKAIKILSDLFSLGSAPANLHLLTVGIGSKEGGVIPHVTLKRESVKSKLESNILQNLGQAYLSTDNLSTDQITQELVSIIDRIPSSEASTKSETFISTKDVLTSLYFQLPLALAIIMLGIVVFAPQSRREER